jgi:hypothetical protein
MNWVSHRKSIEHEFLIDFKNDKKIPNSKQYSNQAITWQQNSCEILERFWSELWWPTIQMTMKFLKKFFVKNSSLKVRKSDDHRILMKCFKNFDQNSGGQPQYLTDQLQDLIQLLVIKLRFGARKNQFGVRQMWI